MTGGGAPGAPGILRCLQQNPLFRITVADARPEAVGRYLHPDFVKIPMAGDSDFIPALLELCNREKIDLVLPLVTKELLPLATNKHLFEKSGTRVLVSPAASLEIANNKSRLYQFLQWRGMEVPDFRVVETGDQFETAIRELGYPDKPVCFKPSVSNGSRGFRIINEQIDERELLFLQKPDSTYMRGADALRILSSGGFPELLVSEYLPGEEYSVDCLANQGSSVVIVPRLRKRMINGISVEGEFVKQEEIISYCSQVLQELRLHGNIGIQVKKSASGKYQMLEINPRVQGTLSAGLGAGINLPELAIKQETGQPISPGELAVRWGTKFSRYWQEVFY